ncbi:MAG: LCP family protein [Candidatus Limnocylindrales bacterium]
MRGILAIAVALTMTASLAPVVGAVTPAGGNLSLGSDGRLTILLLGSDVRAGQSGDRTDAIIVASLDPNTHKVAMASIPRDTVRFPRAASNGGGTSGDDRVNFMMDHYSHSLTLQQRLAKFTKDVEAALRIDIDYYAYVRFAGFDQLLDAMRGVTVKIRKAITDKNYDDDSALPHGIHFPSSTSWLLEGENTSRCADWHQNCHRAIVFARTRHGKVGSSTNNDWKRSGRQQQLVMAALQQVLSSQLGDLVNEANDGISTGLTTDAAISLANAQQLFGYLNSPEVGFSRKVVFQPNTWAVHKSGTPAYTYTLRLAKVRGWIATYMPDLTP